MKLMNKKSSYILWQYLLLLTYMIVVIYITCLCRTPSLSQQSAPELFWSVLSAFRGNCGLAVQILQNVALFAPLGFLLAQLGWKKRHAVFAGFLLSLGIELSQLIFHLGLFEYDDILSNSTGAFLGAAVYGILPIPLKWKQILSWIGVICSVVFCFTYKPDSTDPIGEFYFGVDSVQLSDGQITMCGSCFAYEAPELDYSLLLRSEQESVELLAQTGISSPEINAYFLCEQDYSAAGFCAAAEIDPDRTYEVIVRWGNGIVRNSGVYLHNGQVQYSSVPGPEFDGTLLVARPEYDFYVYQRGGSLYWLCGDNFPFEEDGSTYIQYQLQTTQIENLPEERLRHNWFWDNIGFDFEANELESRNGFRVASRPIPTAYSVTWITTGYYTDKKWIWSDCFRPLPVFREAPAA